MRRFGVAAAAQRSAASPIIAVARPNGSGVRSFHSVWSVTFSLCNMIMCTWVGAQWANSYANVMKYGRSRFQNQIDEPKVVAEFPVHKAIGGCLGFCFWFFYTGRVRWALTDYDKVEPRLGPF